MLTTVQTLVYMIFLSEVPELTARLQQHALMTLTFGSSK